MLVLLFCLLRGDASLQVIHDAKGKHTYCVSSCGAVLHSSRAFRKCKWCMVGLLSSQVHSQSGTIIDGALEPHVWAPSQHGIARSPNHLSIFLNLLLLATVVSNSLVVRYACRNQKHSSVF